MKILFICEGYNKDTIIAQPWKHVNEIAKRLKEMGNSVEVLSDSISNFSHIENIEGISTYRIKKGRFLFNFKELLENINQNDIDIINWFSGPFSALYFWRFKNSIKRNVIWTMYKGGISFEDIKNMKLIDLFSLYNFRINMLYSICPNYIIRKGTENKKIKKYIVWSNRLKRYLENIGVKQEKIALIPSGVDTNKFKPERILDIHEQKQNLGFHENDPVILYFGPLERTRGADSVIHIMPIITKKIPSAKLLLLARKPQTDEQNSLERAAKSYKAIKILTGIQTQDELIQYLTLADVVVLPFRIWPHIDCPLTILEAMAMEKPVVTSYTGIIPEIVQNGETGILVNSRDKRSISEEVIKLLNNSELRFKIGKKARIHIKKYYEWDNIINKTLNIYENAI